VGPKKRGKRMREIYNLYYAPEVQKKSLLRNCFNSKRRERKARREGELRVTGEPEIQREWVKAGSRM